MARRPRDVRFGPLTVDEATLERRAVGPAPVMPGWLGLDLRKAAWMTNGCFGAACSFEAEEASFPQVGYTIAVAPARPVERDLTRHRCRTAAAHQTCPLVPPPDMRRLTRVQRLSAVGGRVR